MLEWGNKVVILFVAGLLLGSCAEVEPGEAATTGEKSSELVANRFCRQDSDCPVPAIACQECADGSNFSCPDAVCTAGRCAVVFPTCPEPELIFCGGIAGIRCPSGLECVDDPRDDCSPCRNGADCGGICVELSCR